MQQWHRWGRVGILSLLLTLLVGACGSDDGGNGNPNPRTVNLRGNWRGSWESLRGATGPITVTIRQQGRQVSGTGTIAGGQCGQRGTFIGSVDEEMFEARVRDGAGGRTDLAGDIAADEQSISGTYSVVRGGQCTGDSGTFQLRRQ